MIEHWNGTAWTVQPTSPLDGTLFGDAAVSPSDAWAVGEDYNGSDLQTLVEHWNGKAWTMQDSPNPGGLTGDNYLLSVTGVSASDAWAVGYYDNGSSQQTLIEHWNGTAWKVQSSPVLDGQLSGVSALSATDAWAVGQTTPRRHADRALERHGLEGAVQPRSWLTGTTLRRVRVVRERRLGGGHPDQRHQPQDADRALER